MPVDAVDAPERILVRGVNWLGDAVMTLPALCRLREAYPHAHIAVLTLPKLADLYACQPVLDAVLSITREEPLASVVARLRGEHFDTGLILTHSARTAFPFWLARIPRRVGYGGQGRTLLLTHPIRPAFPIIIRKRPPAEIKRLSVCTNNGDTLFTRRRVKPAASATDGVQSSVHPPVHHLHQYLYLTATLGANPAALAPHLVVPASDVQAVRQRFHLPAPDTARPVFGLNPGAEYGLAKRWPEERFIQAAIALQQRLDCRWVIVGGATDQELASRIAEGIQNAANATRAPADKGTSLQCVWNLAGQTNLRELCAVLHGCDVVLTNDTGPMHVAAAVGASVVVPFGSTSPELTGPGLPGDTRHRLLKSGVVCAPCFQRVCPIDFRCMNGIAAAQVADAMLNLWEGQP